MELGRCLIIFTKPAVPGRVKTRLIGALSGLQAAELHRAFLADLSTRFAGVEYEVRLAWALESGEAIPIGPFPGLRQEGRDLGERQLNALSWAARRRPLVAVVGSDHPTLGRERVTQTFDALASGNDLVVGPARDGGYYLLGARRESVRPELFNDIPWSTDRVLDGILANARQLRIDPYLLPEERDIDRPDDLEWLRGELEEEPGLCPTTRSLFAGWGWIPEEAAR